MQKSFVRNQWFCVTTGKWHEVTNTRFTEDPTVDKKARIDIEGGVENQSRFYLRNCGFIEAKVPLLPEFKLKENKINFTRFYV